MAADIHKQISSVNQALGREQDAFIQTWRARRCLHRRRMFKQDVAIRSVDGTGSSPIGDARILKRKWERKLHNTIGLRDEFDGIQTSRVSMTAFCAIRGEIAMLSFHELAKAHRFVVVILAPDHIERFAKLVSRL